MTWIADYHMHTNYSLDSNATIDEMATAAQAHQLSEIAITNHFEFFKNGRIPKAYTIERLQCCQAELQQFREAHPDHLPIRFGVEIGQPFEHPDYAKAVMETISFDFVLGSIHLLDGEELYFADYTPQNIDDYCHRYLQALYRLADECDYDCLSHLDLIKRYAAFRGFHIHMIDYSDQLDAILKRVIERGKGIEVNTSGIRQNVGEMLPDLSILSRYRNLGGTIITVGSDAHKPDDVAADLQEGYDLVKQAGFTAVCSFENRTPTFHPIG